MAIVPAARYPSQTIGASASYPQGQARNVTVAGDGTGTPLEEAWVNDLWGFLQALLAAGAVTPTDTIDTATSSEYLTALKALILSHAGENLDSTAAFLGSAFTWTGFHAFSSGASMSSLLVSGGGATQFSGAVSITHATNEVIYSAPRTRVVQVPMTDFVLPTSGDIVYSTSGTDQLTAGASGTVYLGLHLPHGCTLTQVRAIVNDGGSGTVTFTLSSITPDFGTGDAIPVVEDTLVVTGTSGWAAQTWTIGETIDTTLSRYRIAVAMDAVGCGLRAFELTYTETRATGSN